MIPVLYRADGTCLGALADCTRCYITQELDGMYEAEIQYPMSAPLFREIENGCYIIAKPDDISEPQKMRVYKQQKPLYGMASFRCEHVRYALNDVPVAPGRYTGTPALILELMAASVDGASGFTFWSDISAVGTITVPVPTTLGKMLAGKGSVPDIFGGEYEFDNNTVKLYNSRGQRRSAEIRYAKNLTGFTCEKNISNTYTHVYPFYYNEADNVLIELAGKTIWLSCADTLPFRRCYMLDLSSEWNTAPTQAQLEAKAQSFIRENRLDEIGYTYRISFVPLWQTEEYKNVSALERCCLCDTVPVIHDPAGERIRARIVRTVYDSIAEKYVEMTLGNAASSFAQTVTQEINKVNDRISSTRSYLQTVVSRQTAMITGNRGGYVVLYDSNGDGEPDEILVMNTPSILTATKVWRWNTSGLGYSSHGYGGAYTTAITMDGSINADFLTSGTLVADLIKAGIISDLAGNIAIDMERGTLTMQIDNGSRAVMWRSGLTFYGANNDVLASMFISTARQGVATANVVKVGERDQEKTVITVDENGKGHISTDRLIAAESVAVMQNGQVKASVQALNGTGVISADQVAAGAFLVKDSGGVPHSGLYYDNNVLTLATGKVQTGSIEITGSGRYAPAQITISGTQYTILVRQT